MKRFSRLSSSFLKFDIAPDKTLLKHLFSEEQYKRIPRLQYGLDKVLFNPGFHFLFDQKTSQYNFDPFLQKIYQPDQFNFNSVSKFVPASKDLKLIKVAKELNLKYTSSTSSISPTLSLFDLLIRGMPVLNIDPYVSRYFANEQKTVTLSSFKPISLLIQKHDNLWSIVIEDIGCSENILSKLGQTLEQLLIRQKSSFKSMMNNETDESLTAEDNYFYLSVFLTLIRHHHFY